MGGGDADVLEKGHDTLSGKKAKPSIKSTLVNAETTDDKVA